MNSFAPPLSPSLDSIFNFTAVPLPECVEPFDQFALVNSADLDEDSEENWGKAGENQTNAEETEQSEERRNSSSTNGNSPLPASSAVIESSAPSVGPHAAALHALLSQSKFSANSSVAPWNCAHCRVRKRRCDRAQPNCFNCILAGVCCEYPSENKRRGRKPKAKRSPDDVAVVENSQGAVKFRRLQPSQAAPCYSHLIHPSSYTRNLTYIRCYFALINSNVIAAVVEADFHRDYERRQQEFLALAPGDSLNLQTPADFTWSLQLATVLALGARAWGDLEYSNTCYVVALEAANFFIDRGALDPGVFAPLLLLGYYISYMTDTEEAARLLPFLFKHLQEPSTASLIPQHLQLLAVGAQRIHLPGSAQSRGLLDVGKPFASDQNRRFPVDRIKYLKVKRLLAVDVAETPEERELLRVHGAAFPVESDMALENLRGEIMATSIFSMSAHLLLTSSAQAGCAPPPLSDSVYRHLLICLKSLNSELTRGIPHTYMACAAMICYLIIDRPDAAAFYARDCLKSSRGHDTNYVGTFGPIFHVVCQTLVRYDKTTGAEGRIDDCLLRLEALALRWPLAQKEFDDIRDWLKHSESHTTGSGQAHSQNSSHSRQSSHENAKASQLANHQLLNTTIEAINQRFVDTFSIKGSSSSSSPILIPSAATAPQPLSLQLPKLSTTPPQLPRLALPNETPLNYLFPDSEH